MNAVSRHPCFSDRAHGKYGRMHIPCAPRCNLNCAFCGRGIDHGERCLPGRTMRIVRPNEVRAYVSERLEQYPGITVLGIAGPGEPLYNPETLEVFEILHRDFPEYTLCLGTNGLLLPKYIQKLGKLNIQTLTVTVNTLNPDSAIRLTGWIQDEQGNRRTGPDAGKTLISCQLEGIEAAATLGIQVKVNTVYVPGINDSELVDIARTVRSRGAAIMNVMPLHPAGRMSRMTPPTPKEIHAARRSLEAIIPQFHCCTQCRADACGIPTPQEEYDGCVK